MNEPTPYLDATAVLADRVRWAVAVITHLIHRGRTEGWLAGAPVTAELPSVNEVEAQIDARIAISPQEVAILPMQWVSARLRLDPREAAVLWLLACVELSPAVARLIQAFGGSESAELSLQLLQQLVPVSSARIDALAERGLIETTRDPRLPAQRRPVRASDRVVDLVRGELELDREIAVICELVIPDEIAARRHRRPARWHPAPPPHVPRSRPESPARR